MPVSPILLLVLIVLASSGFLAGPLRRLSLSERQGIALLGALLLGSLVELPLTPRLTLNLGTGLLPLCFALYLARQMRRWWEPLAAVGGAATGAAALALISLYFPPGQPTELNLYYLDAQYLYAVVAGTLGYAIGHTRPAAFAAAVLGSLGADLYHYLRYVAADQPDLVFRMSGGGFHGTALVAGILALTLVELMQGPAADRPVSPDLPVS